MHINKINNKKYVGITGNDPVKRWQNGKGYYKNRYFNFAIKKYGWDNFEHKILYENLTKEEAESKEIELIANYNLMDSQYGYNIQAGGNLRDGIKIYQYDRFSGKFVNEYLNFAEIQKLYGYATTCIRDVCIRKRKTAYDYYWSYEFLGEVLSEELLKQINNNKVLVKVAQYDFNGNFLKVFNSRAEASDYILGKDRGQREISLQSRTSYGYIWRKVIDDKYPNKISKKDLEWILDDSKSYELSVAQYDLDGKFINSYRSITKAATETGIHSTDIGNCCKNKLNHAGGFIWRYIDDLNDVSNLSEEDMKDFKIKSWKRSVIKYSKEGNFIAEYNTISDAARSNNVYGSNITKCCRGKIKSVGGYVYKYKDNKIEAYI